jgi:hypothetical protein
MTLSEASRVNSSWRAALEALDERAPAEGYPGRSSRCQCRGGGTGREVAAAISQRPLSERMNSGPQRRRVPLLS